jgi:hypothetical protein
MLRCVVISLLVFARVLRNGIHQSPFLHRPRRHGAEFRKTPHHFFLVGGIVSAESNLKRMVGYRFDGGLAQREAFVDCATEETNTRRRSRATGKNPSHIFVFTNE